MGGGGYYFEHLRVGVFHIFFIFLKVDIFFYAFGFCNLSYLSHFLTISKKIFILNIGPQGSFPNITLNMFLLKFSSPLGSNLYRFRIISQKSGKYIKPSLQNFNYNLQQVSNGVQEHYVYTTRGNEGQMYYLQFHLKL